MENKAPHINIERQPHPNPPLERGGKKTKSLSVDGEGQGEVERFLPIYGAGQPADFSLHDVEDVHHTDFSLSVYGEGQPADFSLHVHGEGRCGVDYAHVKNEFGVDLNHWQVPTHLWEKLKPLARQMRKDPTSAEKLLWQMLRKKQVLNTKFRRQFAIERFIVDFYDSKNKIIIEVDGDIHQYQKEADALRQEFLESLGYLVLRFTNDEVFGNMDRVITRIEEAIKTTPPQSSPK
ncbi:MAG: endonuclease domain-containing protein [bacterium]